MPASSVLKNTVMFLKLTVVGEGRVSTLLIMRRWCSMHAYDGMMDRLQQKGDDGTQIGRDATRRTWHQGRCIQETTLGGPRDVVLASRRWSCDGVMFCRQGGK